MCTRKCLWESHNVYTHAVIEVIIHCCNGMYISHYIYIYITCTYTMCVQTGSCITVYIATRTTLIYVYTHTLSCCCFISSAVSDSLRPYELQPARLRCPWHSLGKSTRVGCHTLLEGIFLTQGLNPGLLHCWESLYCWTTREAHTHTISVSIWHAL